MLKPITIFMFSFSLGLSPLALAVSKKTTTKDGHKTTTMHEFDDGHKVRVTSFKGEAISAGAKGPTNEHWSSLAIGDSKILTSEKRGLKHKSVSVQVNPAGGVAKTSTVTSKITGSSKTHTEFSHGE